MITFTLILAAILIVSGAFVLYNCGFAQGYSIGHDHGFRHANGEHLPPRGAGDVRWELTQQGEGMADAIRRHEGGEV